MKKNYFSPEIVTMEVQFTSVLCGSPNDGVKGDMPNPFTAPKRERPY